MDDPTPYQGARDIESLHSFVLETVGGAAAQEDESQEDESQSDESQSEEEPKATEVERDEHSIVHLTDANFNNFINSKEGVLFVKFYAPW